jgi:hypothetical protein
MVFSSIMLVSKSGIGMFRHLPGDDHSIEAIYDRRQIELSVSSLHLCDVDGPLLIGPICRKVSIDEVGWGIGDLSSIGIVAISSVHAFGCKPFLCHQISDNLFGYYDAMCIAQHQPDSAISVPALVVLIYLNDTRTQFSMYVGSTEMRLAVIGATLLQIESSQEHWQSEALRQVIDYQCLFAVAQAFRVCTRTYY